MIFKIAHLREVFIKALLVAGFQFYIFYLLLFCVIDTKILKTV